ncbi:MAG TPA: hypothetical protein VGW57_07395 [Chthoniobacterales bacterium]|nr:hypothetical protein [Chthoniobacterales bacterium]
MKTNSSPSHSDSPRPDSSEPPADIRKRAERLHEKVSDLSKTLDHIEQTLSKAAGDSKDSRD